MLNDFARWFNGQVWWVKLILLLIPFVGWVVEVLLRLNAMLNHKDVLHTVVFVVFVVVGWAWVLCVADLVYMLLVGHLFLADNK